MQVRKLHLLLCREFVSTPMPRQITQASGGSVTGTEIFTGKGISSSGLFTPAVAGVGTHSIHYVYTSDKGCQDFI